MRRRLAVGAAVLVVLLVVLEVAAVPLATRVIGAALSRCVRYEQLEVTAVDRPVIPRLLAGRARGVELRATGVDAGDVRLAEARLRLPEAVLPWAPGDPDPAAAELGLRVDERDLERTLRSMAPLGLPVEVELRPGVARLGAPVLPVSVDLEVLVDPDGTVRLRPVRGGELFERFGVARSFPPSDAARVTSLRIEEGALHGALTLDVVPGVGGGEGCRMPVVDADEAVSPEQEGSG